MYLAEINTLLVKALREAFDHPDYPVEKLHGTKVSLDYPIAREEYPAVWVEFTPQGSVRNIGIGHREYITNDDDSITEVQRWTFRGTANFTVVALDSLERMDIADELIKIFAFGLEDSARKMFRGRIETNGLIATQMDWDEVDQRGFVVTQGTPWGTNDVVYEGTLAMEVQGEFLSDGKTDALIRVDEFRIIPRPEGQPDTTTPEGWV